MPCTVVFTPKYRRKAIYGQIRSDIGEILRRLCEHKGVEIIEGHLMSDHVHMLLAIPPKYSVSSVMGYLKGKALEDGDKRLAASYATFNQMVQDFLNATTMEEAERIARSGKLSDRESALLSPDIAFICLHAGGLVAECGYCGCLVDEHWDFCARCGTHFMDRRYVAEFGDLDV